jgi:hypothetical protein
VVELNGRLATFNNSNDILVAVLRAKFCRIRVLRGPEGNEPPPSYFLFRVSQK